MDRTDSGVAQLQGRTKNTYQSTELRHAKMCYKRIHEATKILERAKLKWETVAGKLSVKDHAQLMHWVNHHKKD